ncbi:MAG: sialate O-acetylesterase [Bryobacteraceae bacterium]
MNRFAIALALSPFVYSVHAQDVKINAGVVEDQVFQRNAEERADLKFSGSADRKVNKYIEARVTQKGAPVAGFDWTPVSRAKAGQWSGELKGLPTGGPYTLEVRVTASADVVSVKDILVGDLWVLAGQSNMEGNADLIDVTPPTALVHSFDMADDWGIAREPLHNLTGSIDPVHWRKNANGEPERLTGEKLAQYNASRKKGAGLGLSFAEEMLRRTGVPVGLIPCAHGGTSMSQWDPALRDKGGDSLYGSMFRRFQSAGGKVKGVLWYQGESDANPKDWSEFLQKFENFVGAVRKDFNEADLPFYYVQIGRHVSNANVTEWNLVQEIQRKAESIPHTGMVASVDLALDDPIHIGTAGQQRLGHRLANLATHDLFPTVKENASTERGPRPVSAKFQDGIVRVTFNHVNGRLVTDGRIGGFSIHARTGEDLPVLYKAIVDPANPSVVDLYISPKLPENAVLWYGFGKNPYCNLRDTADMAAPVFGPMPIQ